MPFFTRRSRTHADAPRSSGYRLHNPFQRRNKNRVAGGYVAALSNPNTTRRGRKDAKRELKAMGRGNQAHVPFMTKIKRALGIRSTSRRTPQGRRRGGGIVL